jgi:hypothetical protein
VRLDIDLSQEDMLLISRMNETGSKLCRMSISGVEPSDAFYHSCHTSEVLNKAVLKLRSTIQRVPDATVKDILNSALSNFLSELSNCQRSLSSFHRILAVYLVNSRQIM